MQKEFKPLVEDAAAELSEGVKGSGKVVGF